MIVLTENGGCIRQQDRLADESSEVLTRAAATVRAAAAAAAVALWATVRAAVAESSRPIANSRYVAHQIECIVLVGDLNRPDALGDEKLLAAVVPGPPARGVVAGCTVLSLADRWRIFLGINDFSHTHQCTSQ